MVNKNKREIEDAAAADLARRAEEILRQNPSALSERMKNVATPAEMLEAVTNLRIHEIELEMQNEELRRTQMQLTASNLRYFDLYELAPVGYITVSENGQILRANLTATSQLGMARDQLTTQRFSRFILKADQDIFYLLRRQLIKTREPQTCELRMQNKDGSPFWAKLEASVDLAEAGEKQEIILRIVLVDISELKDKEQELRDSHWRMESIIEGTQLGTWEWNIQTGETVFNDQWAQTIGYTLEELAPISIKTWRKYSHPDDLKKSDELLKRYFAGELPTYYFESRMRHKDGRWVWVLDRGRVFSHSAEGKPLLMFGTHADITERKFLEEEIKTQRDYITNIINIMGQGLTVTNAEGRFEFVNPAYASFFGYQSSDLIGKRPADISLPEEVAVLSEQRKRRIKGQISTYESRLVRKNGSIADVLITGAPREIDGQYNGSIAVITDITERKQMEEALRQNEEKYRTVADFTYDWEAWRGPDNTYLYVSPSCEWISGYTAAEFLADPDLVVQITHPDDKSIVMAHYKSTANQSQSEDMEFDFRILAPDGETRWIAHSCTAVYAADGKWLGRRESNREITERKKMGEALEVEKEILVKLLSVSEDFLGNSETEIDYQKLCDNLLLITGAQYSIFNMYEENGRDFQTLGISGLNENIQKASAMFGFDLIGKKWAYDEKRAAKIQGNDITRLAALSDLTESGISKPLVALMEKLFNLGELVLVKILVNGKVLGDFTLIMDGGKRFTADNPVSIYARQVGLLIQRKQAEAKLLHAQEELKESYLREQQLASIDGLTGINNHRSLLKLAGREFNVAMRYQPPLSMMFFDIDNFKRINDTYGHAMGDEALKLTIQAVCGKLRSADLIGRYGGDEFVILLPQTTAQDALPLAERIHASIAAMRLETERGPLTLTISIGIAQSIHDASQSDTVEELLQRADLALYSAKQAGKNCTMIFDADAAGLG